MQDRDWYAYERQAFYSELDARRDEWEREERDNMRRLELAQAAKKEVTK